ncbi:MULTISPECIES: GNAT family N-acetyltransferase [Oceanibaculum]|uniref:Acetyltransferase (GNAT) family protein n=1 Tax=Oceanibaculum indicum TaxID=526216 RepID=A0A420WI22_9PROT|nr:MULTISPECIES: GNAT family N-acetyltransferase [Oceanibaculum]MCH2394623.1 GNAT family N-acetyltransferase [Oceanibaculum sp.]RKQ70606.1 acetyltransferase (GNAT) family protein [Oceanibaculum indicum]
MLVYRRLWPTDSTAYSDHLARLTPEQRHYRFGGFVDDGYLSTKTKAIDWFRCIAIGCFVDGVLRGAVFVIRAHNGWIDEAELAITVEADFEGRGIGTQLMRRVVTLARNRGVHRVTLFCLSDNRRLLELARKFDPRMQHDHGEAELTVDLGIPDQMSYAEEALGLMETTVGSFFEQLGAKAA